MTPSIAGDLLKRYDLRAGVRHGQHFLVDPNTVRRIIRLADVRGDETIVEIGPGLGSLTVALADCAARVVAIELDDRVARALDEVLDGRDNVEVVIDDAMDSDIASLVGAPARLVANLPYNVATPLMLRVLIDATMISGGLVMVQREIGERWTAHPSTRAYNAVSVRVEYHAEAQIVGDVPRTVFMPPPKVASVLVAFTRREQPPVDVADERAFFAFVQDAFAHRRKVLGNSLAAQGYDKVTVRRALDQLGLGNRVRPEDLSLDQYATLYGALS